MKNTWLLTTVIVLLLILGGLVYVWKHADISALPEPGPTETSAATSLKDRLIHRSARTAPQPAIQDNAQTVSEGKALYGMECAFCHGRDGRTPTPVARSMYPRVPSLDSQLVQKRSDRELFWIIHNGIRFSGMPGFANINTDKEIWQLAYYVRSVGKPTKP